MGNRELYLLAASAIIMADGNVDPGEVDVAAGVYDTYFGDGACVVDISVFLPALKQRQQVTSLPVLSLLVADLRSKDVEVVYSVLRFCLRLAKAKNDENIDEHDARMIVALCKEFNIDAAALFTIF